MGRMKWIGVVAAAVVLLCSSARAEQDEFNREGAFAGAGASFEIPAFQGILTGRGGDSWGFNVRGGYRFNEFVAAEGIFEYADKFGGSVTSPFTGRKSSADVQTNMGAAGGKLILPLGRFQPYLWGGVGLLNANGNAKIQLINGRVIRASDSNTGFAGRIASGLDFFLTREISLYTDASYVMPATGPTDLYYFSLGFGGRYNF